MTHPTYQPSTVCALMLLALTACSCFEAVEPDSASCAVDSDCYTDERCVNGACEPNPAATAGGGDTPDSGVVGGDTDDAAMETDTDEVDACITFVSGAVTNESGAAIEGALISGGLAGAIRTDDSGTYALDLEVCQTPSHTLTASHVAHCDVVQEVRPNNMTSITADFVMVERYIAGTILTDQAKPVPGITLFINGSETRDVSDADGRFRLAPLPSGELFTVIVRDETGCYELSDSGVTFDAEPCQPSGELLEMTCREPNACGGCCVALEPADAVPGEPCEPESPCAEGSAAWRCQGVDALECVCE